MLQSLASIVAGAQAEFKATLPAVNAVIEDMVTNDADWQANPVVKASEAVVSIMNPAAVLDIQAAIGAASLVQALWQVFGPSSTTSTTAQQTQVSPSPSAGPNLAASPASGTASVETTTLQSSIAAAGQSIPAQIQASGDPQPSHM
jgi:hypothetical protein